MLEEAGEAASSVTMLEEPEELEEPDTTVQRKEAVALELY